MVKRLLPEVLARRRLLTRPATLLGATPNALQTLGARWAGKRHQQRRKPSPLSTPLDHITMWLDVPGCRAAAYVALSRVQYDTDYLM